MENSDQSEEAVASIAQELQQVISAQEESKEESKELPKGGLDSNKLYQVIKALSAMRLCKNDNTPSPILVRNPDYSGSEFAKAHMLYDKDAHTDQSPSLYQGSIGVAYNRKALDAAKITHIVTSADKINARFADDFKYLLLPLLDTPTQNILQFFAEANKFIVDALESDPNARVLIHCFAGKSRASTITTQFLMTYMKIQLDTALRHVKRCRPIAQPNVGFVI